VLFPGRAAVELLDVKTDPLELTDTAGQTDLKKVEARLHAKLASWMKAQGDQGVAIELKAQEGQGRGKRGPRPNSRERE